MRSRALRAGQPSGKRLKIRASGLSDVGLKRDRNEDAFSADEALGLFVVADGTGANAAGETAARIAVDLINKSVRRWSENDSSLYELFGPHDHSLTQSGNYLLSGIRLANRVIHELAEGYEQYRGMGAAVAALYATPSLIAAANAGNSRIYLARKGELEMLSKDHTVVAEQMEMGMMSDEEAASSPLKHVLTLNLGASRQMDPEVQEAELFSGDRFLLCSNGLTDLVSDDEILEVMRREKDPNDVCRRLLDKVLKRGAHDNTTMVVAHFS